MFLTSDETCYLLVNLIKRGAILLGKVELFVYSKMVMAL